LYCTVSAALSGRIKVLIAISSTSIASNYTTVKIVKSMAAEVYDNSLKKLRIRILLNSLQMSLKIVTTMQQNSKEYDNG